jgi:nitrate reductase NapAB chaperone NapD
MKYILSICLITLLFSCNSNELANLNSKIRKLEKENLELKERLKEDDFNKVESSQLYLFPHNSTLKTDKSNTFTAVISQIQNYPQFKAYLSDNKGQYKEKDEIIIKNLNQNKFEFDYIPKENKLTESVNVSLVFRKNDSVNTKAVLHSFMELPVRD